MKYGFVLPGGTPAQQLEQAVIADQAGWDGVFVWEAAYGVDAWSLLSAMAVRTERIRLGTMLTPLPWRRPWKVASQVATLDSISNGRAILSVGLGATPGGLGNTGEELGRRARADMLDEGIDLIRGLWEGRLGFDGQKYTMHLEERASLLSNVEPVQERIPIWAVGAWPRPKSLRRLLRCDGVLPTYAPVGATERPPAMNASQLREMVTWLQDHGAPAGFDVVMEGETPPNARDEALAKIAPLAEAGATWWIESRWEEPLHSEERMREVRDRLAAGPPRL